MQWKVQECDCESISERGKESKEEKLNKEENRRSLRIIFNIFVCMWIKGRGLRFYKL